jgi:5-methylcytosine-specific restriction endonuclease McrA
MAKRKVVRKDRACKHCGKLHKAGYKFCSAECRDSYHGRRKMVLRAPTDRRCGHCGEAFRTKHPFKRFCSRHCRRQSEKLTYRVKRDSICQGCGCAFNPKRTDRTKFCSRGCAFRCQGVAGARKRELKEARQRLIRLLKLRKACRHCGLEFIAPHLQSVYCSESCRNERNRAKALERYIELSASDRYPRPCHQCGNVFTPEHGNQRRKFCSRECGYRYGRRIAKAKRRSKKRHATAESIDPFQVFERDGWRCQLCGRKTLKRKRGTPHPKAPELDHIVALADGGHHIWANVQTACRQCNHSKGCRSRGQLFLIGEHTASQGAVKS